MDEESLHFGHYKALVENDRISEMDRQLREIPFTNEIVPPSWKKIMDVQILKKEGVYQVDKMRTITLLN